MAHIIVVGNEKGGSGKSTTSMHVATALARLGFRVGALDLDLRQKSFGRYIENRRAYTHRAGLSLPTPDYRDLPDVDPASLQPGENLHEKLLIGESPTGTRHRKIMRATESYLPWSELREVLQTLEKACDEQDVEGIRSFLDELLAGPDMASRLAEIRKPADIVPLKPPLAEKKD